MIEGMITVIVPIYNVEKYLEECILSLVSQTYQNIEILLIDDGSSDGSAKICQKWVDKDIRVKYIYQENSGVGAARNRGLKEARGKYLTFVDADDFLCDTFSEQLLNILIYKKADIVCCEPKYLYEDGRSEIKGENSLIIQTWKSTEWEYTPPKGRWSVWGALYQRKILNGLYFMEDLYVAEDAVFFAKAVRNAAVIAYYDAAIYNYRILEVSACHGPFDMKKYTELEAWKRVVEIFDDGSIAKLSAQAKLVDVCLSMISHCYMDKEFDRIIFKNICRTYRLNLPKLIKYYVIKRKNPFKYIVKGMFPWVYVLYLRYRNYLKER